MALEQIIRELDNRSPDARIAAIKKLAATKDPKALKPLAAIYRSDPDPEVRETARKAGLYIRKYTDGDGGAAGAVKTAAATASASAAYAGQLRESTPAVEKQKPTTISPVQEKRAKESLEAAMDYFMRGDNDKASKFLRKAFENNPKFRDDPYSIGLASQITGEAGQAAVNAIMGGKAVVSDASGASDHRGKQMRKEKKETVESDWFGAGIWATILGATLVFGPLILFAVLLYIAVSLLGVAALDGGATVEQMQAGVGEAIVSLIPTFAFIGGFAIIGIIGQIIVTHFTGKLLFNGEGKLSTITYKFSKFLTILLAGLLIAVLAGTIMTPFWPAVLTTYTAAVALLLILTVHYPFVIITLVFFLNLLAGQMTDSFSDPALAQQGSVEVDPIAILIFAAAFMLQAAWAAKLTADAHKFDIVKGVVSVVVGYLGLIAIAFGAALLLSESVRQLVEIILLTISGGSGVGF